MQAGRPHHKDRVVQVILDQLRTDRPRSVTARAAGGRHPRSIRRTRPEGSTRPPTLTRFY